MTDEQLALIVQSYGLGYILETVGVEPWWVLRLLIEEGEVDEEELRIDFWE